MRCDTCHATVKPVVALDIDGTLGRYHEHFLNFLEKWLDRPLPMEAWRYDGDGEFSDATGLTKHTYQQAKLAFRAGGFKRWMPAFDGTQQLVNVALAFGAELWITTTRPWMRMDNIDEDTRFWLERMSIPFKGLLFDEHKYQMLCDRIDKGRIAFVLEDQWDMYDEADALGLPVHLARSQWNRAIHRQRACGTLGEAATAIHASLNTWREQHEA